MPYLVMVVVVGVIFEAKSQCLAAKEKFVFPISSRTWRQSHHHLEPTCVVNGVLLLNTIVETSRYFPPRVISLRATRQTTEKNEEENCVGCTR